jgi:hypothetical protein
LTIARPLFRRFRRGLVVVMVIVLAAITLQAGAGPVTYSGFNPEGQRIVGSAVARFEAASLQLPLTHVRRITLEDRCQPRGKAVNSWPVKVAKICVVQEDVVVHELAHAWTFVHLTDDDRLDFALRRGTPTWRSREHPWMDRASEHAADIITWYLYWSETDEDLVRIAGDVSIEAYLSDLSWLVAQAETPAAMEVLVARATDLAPMWVASESQ